ncbi:hypothetical protein TIFTF001_044212 [Ficus carica]|uniref:Uncharacterized protein n=1 Tax=Ficus carica TaxID=3494 RepID=A0AA88CRC2_FICCA|nr:hypothetical protein TIFTF001_044212 [Ficus carica]
MYSFAVACYWAIPLKCAKGVIGAILDLHDDLVKVVEVFALRNAVEKASDNCLNESIVPNISLRYHCRAVELLLKVVQLILIVRLDHWWSANRGISASTAVDPSLSQVVKHRGHAPRDVHHVILRSQFGLYSTKYSLLGFPRMLRSPVRSTTGPGLLDLLANRGCPAGEDSSASFSRVGWGRSPRNSLKLCIIVLCLISCKREAPPSKGDTSELSAKGTPMLKSVGGVLHGFGYSDDPDGLYSEWSW